MAIDKDLYALKNLASGIRKIAPECGLILCSTQEEALRYAAKNTVDVVFLDSGCLNIGSLEPALKLKSLNPRVNIIFTSDTDRHIAEAFKLRASGYLYKPVGEKEIQSEFENLRYPLGAFYKDNRECKLRVKCFGNFEVFGPDNNPLAFPRLRCKEALAYLVDRAGAGVTVRQIAAVLWEGREFDLNLQKQSQTILASMMKTLKESGADGVISKRRNNIAILPDKVECDYYSFLKGEPYARDQYAGEYMSQYSWSEYTNGDLWRVQSQLSKIHEKGKKELDYVKL